ncbi:MAG: N-formylglutamate amidohydrolase [Polyangiaceae bacterium]|nr:N-formylglutamate amidohydrolase [Polyangiaceae bacterium]
MFFDVVRPQAPAIPVLVEVPHAGLEMDAQALAYCTAPGRSLGQDADLYVSQLFNGAPGLGATLIHSRASRYYVDLNRRVDDLDSHTTAHGRSPSAPHGVVWRRTTDGRPAISAPLPSEEIERRLNGLYKPYHSTVRHEIQTIKKQFGFCVLLCGHSMPSFGRFGERRADIVPGSQGGTSTGPGPLRAIEAVAKEYKFSLEHDAPYKGGYSTAHYGRPDEGVHALQLELSRRLYMDELTLKPNTGFGNITRFCSSLVAQLGALGARGIQGEFVHAAQ